MMHSDTEVRDNEGHMVGSCKTLRDNGKLSTASAFLPPPGRLRLLSYLAVGVLWPAKSRHELRIAHGKAIESSERKARKASFLTDLSYWCIHLCLEHIVQISNTGFPASSAVDWRPCKRRDSFMVHEANLGKGAVQRDLKKLWLDAVLYWGQVSRVQRVSNYAANMCFFQFQKIHLAHPQSV